MKRIALPILAAASMLAQVANAQSSSTPVIGYYKFDVPAGASAWASGFVTKKDFQGAATSAAPSGANTEITQTGAAWTPGAFSLHYVEILSGSNAGLILDIVSNTATTVTVEGTVAIPASTTYCIRKHNTLGTVLANGGGLAPNEDIVVIIDGTGNESNAVYDGAGGWFNLGDSSDMTNTPVYPGQGFVVLANAARVCTIGGNDVSYVKYGPTRISLFAAIPNLVGALNPLVATNVSDPIYSTSAVSGAKAFGLDAIAPNEDLVIKPTLDGAFDTEYNYIFDGSNVTDISAGGNLDLDPIRNGTAVIFVPGSDISYTLPQLHPNP